MDEGRERRTDRGRGGVGGGRSGLQSSSFMHLVLELLVLALSCKVPHLVLSLVAVLYLRACKLDFIFCLKHRLDESRACHRMAQLKHVTSHESYRSLRLKPATGLDDSRNACHGQEHARSPARTASPDSFHSFPYAGVKTW